MIGLKKTKVLKKEGPRPFVTKLISRDYSGIIHIWESRLHRKGLEASFFKDFKTAKKAFWNGFKKVATLNWWISVLFTVGAFIFMLGCVFSLWSSWALFFELDSTEVNFVFFFGSIAFTLAAFLQLLQAYFANRKLTKSMKSVRERMGFNLSSIGFLGALFQFVGTLLFNINTFEGARLDFSTLQADLWIWAPDFVGSIFFLISGYLAFIEVGHSYWKLEIKNLSWWIVFINLLGCMAFMISALISFIPRGGASHFAIEIGLLFTLIGAFCFFIGALLMLPEMGAKKNKLLDS